MATDEVRQRGAGPERIAPADFSPATAPAGSPPPAPTEVPAKRRRRAGAIIAFLALLSALIAVVFWLPRTVERVGPVERPGPSSLPEAAQRAPSAPAPAESPWRDAERAKTRREAQEVLADLLAAREQLEGMAVQAWAPEEFAGAVDTAQVGDRHYRQAEFEQALARYREARDLMASVLSRAEDVLGQALRDGQAGIEAGDAAAAQAAFGLALQVQPGNTDAEAGLKRANVLDQVTALLADGDRLAAVGDLDQARARYREALALDDRAPVARDRLTAVDARIVDREFKAAMSQGYDALGQGRFDAAQEAFRRAAGLKPQVGEADTALAHARSEQTQARMRRLLAQGEEHERQERWGEAARAYERVLAIDPHAANAKNGQARAEGRVRLDAEVAGLLAQPERLASDAVYRRAVAVSEQARAVAQSGSRLAGQVDTLARLLKVAMTPVPVVLASDGRTDVTVYRVGQFGRITTRELALKPGRYVAVGIREGYRDVRVEFTVSAGEDAKRILIQCVEKL